MPNAPKPALWDGELGEVDSGRLAVLQDNSGCENSVFPRDRL